LDALLDVGEALSLDGALKESFDDLNHHLDVNLEVLLLSEEEFGRGVTDVLAELVPVLGVERLDAIINIVVDIVTIQKKVLSDVPGEAGGGLESLDHINDSGGISWNVFAVADGRLHTLEHVSDLTETLGDRGDILFLEVGDGRVGIGEDLVGILDAG
jgi:hypothetical protein